MEFKINLIYDHFSYNGPLPNGLNLNHIYTFINENFVFNHDTVIKFESKYKELSVWEDVRTLELTVNEKLSVSDYILNKNIMQLTRDQSKNDHIYLYVISPYGGARGAFGCDCNYNENKSFFHHISETAKNIIRNDHNVFLFINYSNEGTIEPKWFNIIHNDAKKFSIPLHKIIYCASDYLINYNYNLSKKIYNIPDLDNINVLYLDWSLHDKSKELYNIYSGKKTSFNNHNNKCTVANKSDIDILTQRPYHFLMFNRRLRPHRVYSLCMFNELNIINKVLISYDMHKMQLYEIDHENVSMHIENINLRETIISQFSKIKETDPVKTIDFNDLSDVWGFNFENKEPYLNSYIHITSETNFFELGGYFSEKTWKPIGHLQPFIFMGPVYGLEELKKLGFKTFSPFIDESYDLEIDPEKRFNMIINEINRLSKLPISEIHHWYHNIFNNVIVHNQNTLFKYISPEKECIKVQKKFNQLFNEYYSKFPQ